MAGTACGWQGLHLHAMDNRWQSCPPEAVAALARHAFPEVGAVLGLHDWTLACPVQAAVRAHTEHAKPVGQSAAGEAGSTFKVPSSSDWEMLKA